MIKTDKKELHNIFEKIKINKEKGISELYEKYNNLINAISFSITKNYDTSQDITQTVFIKIYELPKEKLPTQNEASWLYSITKNETLNYIRKLKKEINIEDIYNIPIEKNDIDSTIDINDFNKLLSKLEKDEKEIITLKIISDLSFKEISLILNIPIGTVKWKYYKSLNNLKPFIINLLCFIITLSTFIIRKTIMINSNQPNGIINIDDITIQLDTIDKCLLYICCIFWFIAIIFFKKFKNHQPKRRKNVSK